jgi:Uma2 family endonuclease
MKSLEKRMKWPPIESQFTRIVMKAVGGTLGSMTSAARRLTMTLTEWASLDDDVPGELVDGALAEEEMTTTVHDLVASWLLVRLLLWAEPRGGYVFGTDHKLAVAPRRGRKPDVTVYTADADLDSRARVSTATPLCVVEVISPNPRDTRRDRIEKRVEYARAGIRFYFLVDPAMRTVEVFELSGGRYATAAALAAGKLRVRGLPGLTLDLDALFRAVERLERRTRQRARRR